MNILKAHEFDWWNDEFGISLNELGCVMLETDNPWHKPMLYMPLPFGNGEQSFYHYLKKNEYVSDNIPHVKGLAADWHVTVRYGFLPQVRERHAFKVINRLSIIDDIYLSDVEVWPSHTDEDYECVVVKIDTDKSEELLDANASLGILPNISTFPYQPHLTLGYFKPGTWEQRYNKAVLDSVRAGGFEISKRMK